jgi:ComF family protein
MIASFPEAVKEASSGADLVLPVPLDRARLRNRGFNQAVVLAREVSTLLGVPMYLDVLLRTRSGRPQAGLKGRERRRNVRGCFSLKRPDKIKGCSVLVVDDVLTTGATANECAKILKVGGAREVQLLALAGARPEVTK